MKNYSTHFKSVCLTLLLATMSFQTLNAQDFQKQKSEFIKLINDGNATSPEGERFNLSGEMPFLKDSEFFKASDDKIILPFQAEIMKTIPQWINTGGDKFDELIQTSIDQKSAFEFLISAAAEVFQVGKDKIELKFLWFVADKESIEMKVGANAVVVNQEAKGLSAKLTKITEAEMKISPDLLSGGVNKFFKKFSWDQKVSQLSPKD